MRFYILWHASLFSTFDFEKDKIFEIELKVKGHLSLRISRKGFEDYAFSPLEIA